MSRSQRFRRGRARPGHPCLDRLIAAQTKDVDARVKPAHDLWERSGRTRTLTEIADVAPASRRLRSLESSRRTARIRSSSKGVGCKPALRGILEEDLRRRIGTRARTLLGSALAIRSAIVLQASDAQPGKAVAVD